MALDSPRDKENRKKFEVKLPLFEGPFDLLLFFIERDELDIYDIPIATITHDFLDYLHQMEKMNVEIASEFILVAATLMRIKAKMLLPRPIIDDAGNQIDPRDELVKHLLEYKKYKSVVDQLSQLEIDRFNREQRGNLMEEIKKLSVIVDVDAEVQDLDLYKLMKVFQRVIDKYELDKNKPIHRIAQYPYTIESQKEHLIRKLFDSKDQRISFTELLSEKPEKILAIFNFLAILELLQLKKILLHIGEGFNNFWIEPRSGEI
ncbi:MAG: segregation/condensation protein A [Flammeovirgaceae bacterium]|jgi:segregation and condensation protein A|nr:segregation/condensation protein A [Flammeovirgaceae bacterium]|tara:strand:+ start:18141 stop:18926 length:786 start_codon:yes stop_codon:yes gene_type:complete